MNSPTLKFAALAICTLFATPSFADQDPNRPTGKIAADLGVKESVFIACFKPVKPEPNKKPGAERQRSNKAVLLPCLQKANPKISNDRLDKVMDKYRLEGPMRKQRWS